MEAPVISYIALPREAVLSRQADVEPWTRTEKAAWIALPATWNLSEHCWEVTLDVTGKPLGVGTAQRDGWRTLVKWDVPSGLYPVRVNIRRQRWRTPAGTMLSPIPAYFGTQGSGAGKRGRPAGSSRTPGLEAFQQIVRIALPASAGLIRRRLSLPGVVGTSTREPRSWLTRRPTTLPEHLVIDELWIQQTVAERLQRGYWTVVSDDSPHVASIGQRVLGLCKGRDVEQIQPMLREIMDWYAHGLGPDYVTTDMWSSFRDVMKIVSPFTDLLFDRFHFERHIRQAVDDVWNDCTAGLAPDQVQSLDHCTARPCTCGLRDVCRRWQHALRVEKHLAKLWSLSSTGEAERFLADWDQLSNTRWDDFSKVQFLLDKWRDSVLSAAFLRNKGGATRGTALAELVNRELRRVIRQYRITPLEHSLDQLFDVLHTPRPEPKSLTAIPPIDRLLCPACGATGPDVQPSHDAKPVQVRHLPCGLDQVTLVLPSIVVCARCGGPQVQPTLSQALTDWLQEPAQLALSQAELVRLTGLSTDQVRRRVEACLTRPAAVTEPSGDVLVLVYGEVWTSRRVWLVLSCPVGGVVEITHVPIKAGKDDKDIHARVAARLRVLVEPYRQKWPLISLHLTTQTGKLAKELRPWIREGRVTLKEFLLRSLVIKFRKQALGLLKDFDREHATALTPQIKAEFLDDPSQIPGWRLLEARDLDLADLLLDLDAMEQAIAESDRQQIRHLLRLRPFLPRNEAHAPSTRIRVSMWATWTLWAPAINATLASPVVNTGYEPHLMARIREHLQTSPALHVERQRRRLLLVLAEERRVRQEAQRS